MANGDLREVVCSFHFGVDILFLENLNYTESQSTNVINGCKCKANTSIWFHVQFYKRSKFFYYLLSLHHLTV